MLSIFNLSLQTGNFPDKLKIGSVTPLFEHGENYQLRNYRPIYMLLRFSKMLEKIIHNCLYKYRTNNDTFYKSQFGFRENYSTECAIVQLVDQIRNSFQSNQYTLGVFIDLFKAFDTVNHKNLISQLEISGIRVKTLLWFRSY